MITTINRQTCRAIYMAVEERLEDYAKENGLAIKVNGGSYSDSNFKCSIEFAIVNENGEAETIEAQSFKANAGHIGMKPEDLGREFMVSDTIYQIKGYKRRSKKYPIVAERVVDGRAFKFTLNTVKTALTR